MLQIRSKHQTNDPKNVVDIIYGWSLPDDPGALAAVAVVGGPAGGAEHAARRVVIAATHWKKGSKRVLQAETVCTG